MNRQAHVLIADSTPQYRIFASMILKRAGYRVTETHGSEEMIRLATAGVGDAPDLVLLDVALPAWSSPAMKNLLTCQGISPPLCLTAGGRDRTLSDRLSQVRCSGVLYKPYTSDELLKFVKERIANEPKNGSSILG